jgi:hypothetical protein
MILTGVPVLWLLNQFPGSSVKCIVSSAESTPARMLIRHKSRHFIFNLDFMLLLPSSIGSFHKSRKKLL